MSATAEAIVKQIQALPPDEQREVMDEVLALKKTALAGGAKDSAAEADPIRSARGMFAGSGLTAALLASRAEERRRG